MIRTSGNPSAVTYGAAVGAAFLDDMIQVGPEIYGATLLGDEAPLTTDAVTVDAPKTGIELIGGAKLRVLDGLVFGLHRRGRSESRRVRGPLPTSPSSFLARKRLAGFMSR